MSEKKVGLFRLPYTVIDSEMYFADSDSARNCFVTISLMDEEILRVRDETIRKVLQVREQHPFKPINKDIEFAKALLRLAEAKALGKGE